MRLEQEEPERKHEVPQGTSEQTVDALGKLSEALEVIEEARGNLYRFHRLTGRADLALGDAVELFKAAGHTRIAQELDAALVGRNVLEGRWTFQVIEEYDDGYYAEFRDRERTIREQLVGGRRHLYEARMKEDRRTHGRRGHEAAPPRGPE